MGNQIETWFFLLNRDGYSLAGSSILCSSSNLDGNLCSTLEALGNSDNALSGNLNLAVGRLIGNLSLVLNASDLQSDGLSLLLVDLQSLRSRSDLDSALLASNNDSSKGNATLIVANALDVNLVSANASELCASCARRSVNDGVVSASLQSLAIQGNLDRRILERTVVVNGLGLGDNCLCDGSGVNVDITRNCHASVITNTSDGDLMLASAGELAAAVYGADGVVLTLDQLLVACKDLEGDVLLLAIVYRTLLLLDSELLGFALSVFGLGVGVGGPSFLTRLVMDVERTVGDRLLSANRTVSNTSGGEGNCITVFIGEGRDSSLIHCGVLIGSQNLVLSPLYSPTINIIMIIIPIVALGSQQGFRLNQASIHPRSNCLRVQSVALLVLLENNIRAVLVYFVNAEARFGADTTDRSDGEVIDTTLSKGVSLGIGNLSVGSSSTPNNSQLVSGAVTLSRQSCCFLSQLLIAVGAKLGDISSTLGVTGGLFGGNANVLGEVLFQQLLMSDELQGRTIDVSVLNTQSSLLSLGRLKLQLIEDNFLLSSAEAISLEILLVFAVVVVVNVDVVNSSRTCQNATSSISRTINCQSRTILKQIGIVFNLDRACCWKLARAFFCSLV